MVLETKLLQRELAWVARFADSKSTIPILTHVLLAGCDGGLRLTASDLDVTGISVVPGGGEPLECPICVPTKLLSRYLAAIENGLLALSVEGGKAVLRHGCNGAQATIRGMSGESFPKLPKLELAGELSGLAAAIPRVLPAIDTNASRFTLNGALLEVRDDGQPAVLVATDGHRLSVVEIACDALGATRVLLPARALSELAALKVDRAGFGQDSDHLRFVPHGKGREIICRNLTGEFPLWEKIVKSGWHHSISFDALALRKALRCVSPFADDRGRVISLALDAGVMTLTAEVEGGSAKTSLPVGGFASTWRSRFNCDYLAGFAAQVEGPVTGRFSEPEKVLELSVPGWRYLVMPMRT